MATYSNKWDLLDIRFLGIWFSISTIQFWLEKYSFSFSTKLFGDITISFVIASIIILVAIPFTLMLIGEDNRVKRFFLGLFHKYEIIYYFVGLSCFGYMFGFSILYVLQHIGTK